MVPLRLKVEILVSWLWMKCCVFAGIKKLGWYSVGRVRVSLVLNTGRFSRSSAAPSFALAPIRVQPTGEMNRERWGSEIQWQTPDKININPTYLPVCVPHNCSPYFLVLG